MVLCTSVIVISLCEFPQYGNRSFEELWILWLPVVLNRSVFNVHDLKSVKSQWSTCIDYEIKRIAKKEKYQFHPFMHLEMLYFDFYPFFYIIGILLVLNLRVPGTLFFSCMLSQELTSSIWTNSYNWYWSSVHQS